MQIEKYRILKRTMRMENITGARNVSCLACVQPPQKAKYVAHSIAGMHVELHVTEGPAKGQHFYFDTPDCFLVGRAGDAHISLPDDPYLSRQHLLLLISPPHCILTDLNSKNGVFVNGVRYGGRKAPKAKFKQAPADVRELILKDTDRIAVGSTRILVSLRDGAVPVEPSENQTALSEEALQQFLRTKGFRNIRKLCQGSKGPIYQAIEPKDNRDVIVKALQFPEDADPQKTRRLQVELDLLCHLRHRHIVPLIKYGACGQCVFCVIEYVDGIELTQFLETFEAGVPLPEAAAIMLGLLDGLAYAHTRTVTARASRGASTSFQGIVHRDLKPQNIFLARNGKTVVPKLADFGLSRGFEAAGLTDISNPSAIGCAPMYWPREQITHYTRPTLVTDVFALAAIFYHMLTGFPIRQGFQTLSSTGESPGKPVSLADYVRVIVNEAPVPIQQRKPDIATPLADVIDRALREKELPQDLPGLHYKLDEIRYANARAFRSAILNAFQEIGIKPAPLSAATMSAATMSVRSIFIPEQPRPRSRQIPNEAHATVSGTIIYSIIRSASKREVALFVLDVVQSTQHIPDMDGTRFGTLIGQIFKCIKQHPSASELIFLNCTGGRFLALFSSMPAALAVAESFLDDSILPQVHVSMGLHWGAVKTGPNGDVLGTEVHKVCRIEDVKPDDLLEPAMDKNSFSVENRILISLQGLAQLPNTQRNAFRKAGKFHLKGFHNLHELWLYSGKKPGIKSRVSVETKAQK